jgi:hypothetical protein
MFGNPKVAARIGRVSLRKDIEDQTRADAQTVPREADTSGGDVAFGGDAGSGAPYCLRCGTMEREGEEDRCTTRRLLHLPEWIVHGARARSRSQQRGNAVRGVEQNVVRVPVEGIFVRDKVDKAAQLDWDVRELEAFTCNGGYIWAVFPSIPAVGSARGYPEWCERLEGVN